MKRIFKYELEIIGEQTIDLPVSAIFISIIMQKDRLVFYELIDDDEKETKSQKIRIIGTGNPFLDFNECKYLGTVQQYNFIWHMFEKETR